jgi:transposase
MGNPAGVRRDFAALERRRMVAARLLRQGVSQSEVARRLGVHRQSVIRWVRQLAQSGRAGLKKAGRAGRKPRLSPAQLRQLEQGLKRGPEALGYATGLWTANRVQELIEYRTGVRYHAAHVWRILRQLGWSCQRPTGKALERDEEAIRYWKRVRWPRIKKKRSAKGVPSSSSTKAG